MIKKYQQKLKRLVKLNAGFTVLEWIIAAVLISIVLSYAGNLIITTLKNGAFVQVVADTSTLSTQKATELFNDSKNQVAKIPEGETTIGSIDPSQPVDGYFDLFNSYACLLRNTTQIPSLKITVDGQPSSSSNISTSSTNSNSTSASASLPGKGGPLDGDTDGTPLPRIDCSTSTHTNPKESLDPKYRRQWMVVKDFPNKNDVTFSVVVIHLDRNKIVKIYSITKTDGTITK